jgi:hypothetical protein
MNILDFIKTNKLPYRKIDYKYVNGKKVPIGEHNNYTLQQIEKDGGNWGDGINAYSIYMKYVPDLYCIDFDEKPIENSQLYKVLKTTKCYFTETKKGYHYYVKIKNLGEYTNQQKIGNEGLEVDLIKMNNIWENADRIVQGQKITEFKWENIQKWFDVNKMNFKEQFIEEAEIEIQDLQISVPKCDMNEFKGLLNRLDKKRYEYKYWLEVGIICYNNFDGEKEGLQLWDEWSKKDDNYGGFNTIISKWNSFDDNRDCKLSYKRLKSWLIEDNSCNKYELAYNAGGENGLTKLLNQELLFYQGEYILIKENGYDRFKERATQSYYKQFTFKIEIDGKYHKVNPFAIWLENINRKNADKIVFNPRNNSPSNHFNIWTGFDIEPNDDNIDITKLEPILKLIRKVWANDNRDTYEYYLNWFSHILQKPYKKTGVCIALQSRQGVGKTIVINLIGKIIGDKYFYTASSLKHILGDFNGDCEGKLLVNLNECTWGGNKSQEGAFKEFITDDSVVINRKGVNTYRVENYANTIITTNAEWMVALSKDDRRYNVQRCRDITPEEKQTEFNGAFYKSVAKTDLQTLCNYLHKRDISKFNPRVFEKSELHKEQVEKNYDSVEMFYEMMINRDVTSVWTYEKDYEGGLVDKNEIYDRYVEETKNVKHYNILCKVHFWRKIYKISNGGMTNCRKNNERNSVYVEPLERAIQLYNTKY